MEQVFSGRVALLRAARPNFLTLTPVCVLIGIGVAVQTGASISVVDCVLVLLGALAAHVSVNLLNEYEDFRSGLDALTSRTPFSGGSGSLPVHPEMASAARSLGLVSLAVTIIVGLVFVRLRGIELLPLGAAGVLLVVAYTSWITRQPLLCLLAPGLGFGPMMVMGTAFALSGRYSWTAALASLPALFLVSGLLLLNQLPDIDADRSVGRRHLPILWGRRRSAILFAGLVMAAFAVIAGGALAGRLPPLSALGLLPFPAGILLAHRVHRHAESIPRLIPYMGLNVAVVHAVLLLFAVGLLFG